MKTKDELMRDMVLDCGESLFTQYGYKNTSMEKIAEKCQISKPTLYNYFQSKVALFYGIYARLQNELSEKGQRLMEQQKDKHLIIEEIIDLSLSIMQEKQNFLKMLVREHHVAMQECDNIIDEHINLELRRREETSRRLGEFMKDIVRPEILKDFGADMVGTILTDLLEGVFWDSIVSNSIDHEKRKGMIVRLLKNGILA